MDTSILHIKYNSPYIQGGILIHLEMHGNSDRSGLVLSDKTSITWNELVEEIRPINKETCNQLFLTMATCYGRYLYQGVDSYKKSPYSGYISASKEVKTDEIIEKFHLFFEILLEYRNIIFAYEKLEKEGSNFFYKDSEKTFEDAFKLIKIKLENDPEYYDKYINKNIKNKFQNYRSVQDSINELVLNEIYKKQKEAFHFS